MNRKAHCSKQLVFKLVHAPDVINLGWPPLSCGSCLGRAGDAGRWGSSWWTPGGFASAAGRNLGRESSSLRLLPVGPSPGSQWPGSEVLWGDTGDLWDLPVAFLDLLVVCGSPPVPWDALSSWWAPWLRGSQPRGKWVLLWCRNYHDEHHLSSLERNNPRC